MRPSRARRVGATKRSPTPAPAAVGTNAAATTPAARMDLVQKFITATPTLLLTGAVAAVWVRNGLFSVNHERKIAGACARSGSVIDRDVERADIGAGRGGRVNGHRAADREVRAREAVVCQNQ